MIGLAAFLAIVVGLCIGLQGATNEGLKTHAGTGGMLLINTLIVLAGAVVVALFDGSLSRLASVRPEKPYLWLGGIYGLTILLGAPFVVKHMGVTSGLALVIGGQLATAILLDAVGAFGLERRPIDLPKVLGVLLIVIGAFLTRR